MRMTKKVVASDEAVIGSKHFLLRLFFVTFERKATSHRVCFYISSSNINTPYCIMYVYMYRSLTVFITLGVTRSKYSCTCVLYMAMNIIQSSTFLLRPGHWRCSFHTTLPLQHANKQTNPSPLSLVATALFSVLVPVKYLHRDNNSAGKKIRQNVGEKVREGATSGLE
jgi:hypothetical protein